MARDVATEIGGTIPKYAREQASVRLNRFAFELRRASRSPGPDTIHDLRVSIRRLVQCLRIFGDFFPARESKKVRRRLRKILDAAAEVRDRDIAMDLIGQAGVRTDSPALVRLARERMLAQERLAAALKRWRRRELSSRWRAKLGI